MHSSLETSPSIRGELKGELMNRELWKHTQRLRNEMELPDFHHEHHKWHRVDSVILTFIGLFALYLLWQWLR
jgi:hypothetical protein